MWMQRAAAAAALALALAGGCTHPIENPGKTLPGSPTVGETRSSELSRVQFADVPVPSGFELVTRGNRSFSFQGGGVRVGSWRYWGRGRPPEVAAFYRRTMPLAAYGWQVAGEEAAEGDGVLEFTKEGSTCTVSVEQEAGGTILNVSVSGRT